ncbi:MAG TPA: hypothetical protein PLU22_11395 [Polyangiaceae bacterium]|nr:hypothetical protein [Polyangiaceae bacterium]
MSALRTAFSCLYRLHAPGGSALYVLLLGQTSVEKELAARRVHARSR